MMRLICFFITLSACLHGQMKAPKIWDEKALADWATPIAAIGVRPGHFAAAEYYATPAMNLRTYPVYRPDKEPVGYWEWVQKQKPQQLIDFSKVSTREQWTRAGETAFREMDDPAFRTTDAKLIAQVRNPKAWEGVWSYPDGSSYLMRWVVDESGVQLGFSACVICHGRPSAQGKLIGAGPPGPPPTGERSYAPFVFRPNSASPHFVFRGETQGMNDWRSFQTPWAPDDRIDRLREMDAKEQAAIAAARARGTFARRHGSPYYMTKIPDLNTLRYSRYMDATGSHRLRGPEDVARYAAVILGADPMEFGQYRMLKPDQRKVLSRQADELLYAIGVYLMSLELPKNPEVGPEDLIVRGREIFQRETCAQCHVPPNYTSGKLTLAQGFTPPDDHPNKADILSVSVGTDPGLALKTRKGTGFYKIPSLRGVWYRPLLLHDGSVASLEEMFDPDRLKSDHVPGGWKGPGVTKRAIPGHSFGLNLNPADKTALLAFLRSL